MDFVPTEEDLKRLEQAKKEMLAIIGDRTIQEYEDDLERERLARAKIRISDPEYQKLWEHKK